MTDYLLSLLHGLALKLPQWPVTLVFTRLSTVFSFSNVFRGTAVSLSPQQKDYELRASPERSLEPTLSLLRSLAGR